MRNDALPFRSAAPRTGVDHLNERMSERSLRRRGTLSRSSPEIPGTVRTWHSKRPSRKGDDTMEPLQIGDQVPDIRLPLVNGLGDAGFRDFAGKRLIVFAWASW